MDEQQLERRLRRGPRPAAPAELKRALQHGVRVPGGEQSATVEVSHSWLRRWWPVLIPATVCLACVAVLAVQRQEIHRQEKVNQELLVEAVPLATPVEPSKVEVPAVGDQERKYQEEIERLTERANQLRASIADLENVALENTQLRGSATPVQASVPEEYRLLEEARQEAMKIQCVNNLKQFGLAARMWEMDHGDVMPPDIISVSNELSTPKILHCPADTAREAASTWNTFTPANCSYDYLAPGAVSAVSQAPERVLCRCRIHGNVGLVDGSVQMLGENYLQKLEERDGALYLKR